jgi:hypothetical protein
MVVIGWYYYVYPKCGSEVSIVLTINFIEIS